METDDTLKMLLEEYVEPARIPASEGDEDEMNGLLGEAVVAARWYGVDISTRVDEIRLLGRYCGEKKQIIDASDSSRHPEHPDELYLSCGSVVLPTYSGRFVLAVRSVIEKWNY